MIIILDIVVFITCYIYKFVLLKYLFSTFIYYYDVELGFLLFLIQNTEKKNCFIYKYNCSIYLNKQIIYVIIIFIQ